MFKSNFRKLVQPLVPAFVMRWLDPFHTVLLEHLTAAARKLPAGAHVLDAGAGECPHAPLFAHTRYVRLDRGIGDKTWDYTKIEVLGDISELPFCDNAFDAVINIQVLEHLKEPGIGINEMARVLKPGGAVDPHHRAVLGDPSASLTIFFATRATASRICSTKRVWKAASKRWAACSG